MKNPCKSCKRRHGCPTLAKIGGESDKVAVEALTECDKVRCYMAHRIREGRRSGRLVTFF